MAPNGANTMYTQTCIIRADSLDVLLNDPDPGGPIGSRISLSPSGPKNKPFRDSSLAGSLSEVLSVAKPRKRTSGSSNSTPSSPRQSTATTFGEPNSAGKSRRPRPRSSPTEYQCSPFAPATPKFLLIPADAHTVLSDHSRKKYSPPKSNSSPVLSSYGPYLHPKSPYSPHTHQSRHSPPTYSPTHTPIDNMNIKSDSEADPEDEGVIYTSWRGPPGSAKPLTEHSGNLRTRFLGSGFSNCTGKGRDRDRPRTISTTPGLLGAGETETEADEPPRRLPTSRIIPSSGPLIPPTTLQERLTPLLFEVSRLLSIVPAFLGTMYNIYYMLYGPVSSDSKRSPAPVHVDYFVSALWCILTGYQCLCLTTGLLTRWRIYYTPLSTLIRLLALQAICWPATHFTLKILEHEKRPVITWAVIGTTTSVSRSIQIWVTSNLWWEESQCESPRSEAGDGVTGGVGHGVHGGCEGKGKGKGGYWKRWRGGKWGGRRWDWKEVGVKCVLPVGIVYFVMAWVEALRRELMGC